MQIPLRAVLSDLLEIEVVSPFQSIAAYLPNSAATAGILRAQEATRNQVIVDLGQLPLFEPHNWRLRKIEYSMDLPVLAKSS